MTLLGVIHMKKRLTTLENEPTCLCGRPQGAKLKLLS